MYYDDYEACQTNSRVRISPATRGRHSESPTPYFIPTSFRAAACGNLEDVQRMNQATERG